AATSAALGVKWISATNGTVYPLARNSFLILARFSASLILGAVMRTYSQPASTIRMVCSTEPNVSMVSTVVILWIRIGLSPPIGTLPTVTSRVKNRLYVVFELQYPPGRTITFFVSMRRYKVSVFFLFYFL